MNMTSKEKREHLLQLKEDALRREVLIPLLAKQGFHDPILHHHAGEKGKDIVCKELDEKFGKTRYIAVVVKRGDVTGSSSGSNSYFTVINQVKQALNEPYKHVYELREVIIDQVIIVASGVFLPTALDSVYSTLKAERLDKAIRDAIDVGKLEHLIDKFFSEYWEEVYDERTSLLNQRNTLLNNLGKLLKVIVADPAQRESVLHELTNNELDFELLGMRDYARYMLEVGHRRITVEEIDPSFTLPYLNTDHENIKESVFSIKKSARKALMEIEEQIEPLARILEGSNPKEILGYCQDVRYYTNFQGRMGIDVSDVVNDDELLEGVRQYEQRREILEQQRQSKFYAELMKDMSTKIGPALVQFWEKHPRSDRNWWVGYTVRFVSTDQQIVKSAVYEFEEEPKILRVDEHFPARETSKAFVDEGGGLHVEYAVNFYGIPNEDKLTPEGKAEEFIWWYERLLADKFFELS